MLTFFNTAIAFLLDAAYSLTHNYGLAMILFGVLLRVVLAPLDIKSRRSNRKMQLLQPEMNRIREKYKNDPQMQNRKLQEFYRKEKFSPMSGCLPMMLQLPLLLVIFSAMRTYSLEQFGKPLVYAMQHGLTDNMDQVLQSGRFLWVQNIFTADTPFGGYMYPFPPAAQLMRLNASLSNVFTDFTRVTASASQPGLWAGQLGAVSHSLSHGYDAVRAQYLASPDIINTPLNTAVNGLFLMPLLAGGLQFVQSWLSQRNTPQGPENPNASSMKLMTYFFPLFSVYICATYTSLFTLYWITGSLCAIVLQLLMDRHYKAADKNKVGTATVKP